AAAAAIRDDVVWLDRRARGPGWRRDQRDDRAFERDPGGRGGVLQLVGRYRATGQPRCVRPRGTGAVRRRLRRGEVAGAPEYGDRPRRSELRPTHGAGGVPVEAAARAPEPLSAIHDVPCDEAAAQRLLAVF